MSKPILYFNDYVSLTVMLLMIVALVTGQANASADPADSNLSVDPVLSIEDTTSLHLHGYLSDKSLKVSVEIVTDLGHFRGEDE